MKIWKAEIAPENKVGDTDYIGVSVIHVEARNRKLAEARISHMFRTKKISIKYIVCVGGY